MAEDNKELLQTLMGMLGDNPEQKIASALSALNLNNEDAPKQDTLEEDESSQSELDALFKIGNLLSAVNGEDARARLLTDLKPFLSEEKKSKIDSAVKLLKLAKMAEVAGKNDLLKDLKL